MIKPFQILLAIALVGCAPKPMIVAVDSQPDFYAWWLRATFHPQGKSLRGILVNEINPEWCSIDELEKSIFPKPIEASPSDWEPTSDAAIYSTTGLDLGNRSSRLVLAVYRECTGDTGTALVLLEQGKSGQHLLITAEPIASPATWATMELISPTAVRIAWCFNCDSFVDFEWDPRAQRLNAVPEEDHEDLGIAAGEFNHQVQHSGNKW